MKKFTLPKLPYDYAALEPVISGEIMHFHHEKHHNAYTNNLTVALEKYSSAEAKDDLELMISLQQAIRFNGGGYLNHAFFWETLAPKADGGGELAGGELFNQIKQQFGSLESFIEKFNAKTVAVQGSGWGWLGFCPENKILMIMTTFNQDTLQSTHGVIPLLGIDVWEHAYYLQYKNARPDYLKMIWQVINWAKVSDRYHACVSNKIKT